MSEKVKKLKEELAKAVAEGEEAFAATDAVIAEYKEALQRLANLEDEIQQAQKEFAEAAKNLNLTLLGRGL